MEGVKIELALLAALIDETHQEVKAKDIEVHKALDDGRLDIARFYDNQMQYLRQRGSEFRLRQMHLEVFLQSELERLRKESEQKRQHIESEQEKARNSNIYFSLLQYFFPQPSPTSSKKEDPAGVSSPSAGTERCRPKSDADAQQQLDLSLPTGSGLRKRLLKSAEEPE
ncbi:hypothetical protein BJ741DRAFT_580881 [Chytriomyces cf. hyalinus JEL632]|nr:hypothetical protein BJ741DRAFT_580881 [Chytriomyces cf. hyalinus JEL632]